MTTGRREGQPARVGPPAADASWERAREELAALPLAAQVLLASRMVRRVILALPGDPPGSGSPSLRQASRLVDEAARAAGTGGGPADGAAVTEAALDALRALEADERVPRLQLMILFSSDVDQLRFACGTAGVGRGEALPEDVLLRLTPLHPVALGEPRRSPEDDFR